MSSSVLVALAVLVAFTYRHRDLASKSGVSASPVQNGNSTIQEAKLWRSSDPMQNFETTPQTNGIPLGQTYKRILQHDKDMCAVWRDEIEHLLIFAGLFSAIIAAFVLNSYKSLQRDNTEVSAQLLSRLSLQLSAIANNATPVPPSIVLDEVFVPTSGSIRSSTFMLISLGTCLLTAAFSILLLRWLREYARPISLSPVDAITIRQMRYDALMLWRVPMLVNRLPELFVCSICLFSIGVLDSLWSLDDHTVAFVTTICAGVGVLIFGFLTAAPSIQIIAVFGRFISVGYDATAYLTPCPYRFSLSTILSGLIMKLGHEWFKNWPDFKKLWAELEDFSPEWSLRPSNGRRTNVKALTRALKWIIDELSPSEVNQGILQDVYQSLHNGIDRSISTEVLLHWAELTGDWEGRNINTTFGVIHDLESDKCAQHDLLMERLLRKSSPVQENRKLLLELQVRCLNTLDDRRMTNTMGEVFSEAARNCYHYLLENKGIQPLQDIRFQNSFYRTEASSLNKDGLLFQSLMTVMEFYNRLYDYRRMRNVNDHIGSVLDIVIRHTEVKNENALLCYQLLNQFKLMLEGVCRRVGDFSSPIAHQNPCSTVELLQRFDVDAIKKWEMGIQEITGNCVSLVDEVMPFMEKLARVGEREVEGREVENRVLMVS